MWKYFVLLFVCLTSCFSVPPKSDVNEVNSMPPIRYLALGDSYTIGESVNEPERWSNQLADLIETDTGRDVDVKIVARTGWTTDELWQGIQADEINPPYDLVSLLIGVNNQYRGRDIEEYREQFVFLLNKSIEYTGGDVNRVIVLSIPDWGVTSYAKGKGSDPEQVARETDAFNAVNQKETENAGARYIDITPISREAIKDPSLIAGDGLHPSGKMYAMWAEKTLPVALKILSVGKGE